MNPFNKKPYTDQYEVHKPAWERLSAYKQIDTIKESIRKYPLTFIISGTGSGKTVITPRAAIEVLDYKGKVGVSLPKREITRSTAEYASNTMDVELGQEIGFVHKGSDPKMRSDANKLVYMTDGVLVSAFNKDPDLTEYDIIIIDEAHERKVQIDLILLFIKKALLRGAKLKAVIMSATIDKDKYLNYFKGIKTNVIEITGQTNYPITVTFLDKPTVSYIKTGSDIIDSIVKRPERNDTLFFVTSGNEAAQVCRAITPQHPKLFCIEVFAEMNPDRVIYAKERDAFLELGDYDRKVVIATNMAESSLTIKGLEVVIDSGYELYSYFDPTVYGNVLEKKLITKAQAIQRRGRVGRTEPGVCFHLLTESQFDKLEDYPAPAILKQDITIELLQMISMTPKQSYRAGITMLNELMDPPKPEYVEAADHIYQLYDLVEGDTITRLGKYVTRFKSLPVNRTLFLIYAHGSHVLREAVVIVSMIQETGANIGKLFHEGKRSNTLKTDKKSDHITLLLIYKAYSDAKDRKEWCEKHNIKLGMMRAVAREARKLFHQVMSLFQPEQARTDVKNVKKRLTTCLVASHKHLNKSIGQPEVSSVVDKKKLHKKPFIYDTLSKMGGQWKMNIITIV